MRIKKLTLSGLRAFTQAEFEFQRGMNLLVGVNGVGKTTTLEALRICLSKIFPSITASKSRKENFKNSDIKLGEDVLNLSCDCIFESTEFSLLINKKRHSFIESEIKGQEGNLVDTPDLEQILPQSLKVLFGQRVRAEQQPICIYFSTKRSLIVDQKPTKQSVVGGHAAAYADSLSENREFNLRIFAHWFKAQEVLSKENARLFEHVAVLRSAVESFLPGFKNLRISNEGDNDKFIIDKKKTTLNIRQLSDGERGVLSLVMDIARRLSQANPHSQNPLKEGTGIILIDELDLHLHPKWQRTIVENLLRTFPKCQFIASTHSPQIIGEVKPNAITIIDSKNYRPVTSFGVDSSRILEEVLDTEPRTKKVETMLKNIYISIDDDNISLAKKQLVNIIEILGPDDADIIRAGTLIKFLEDSLESNEANKKRKRTK